MHHMTYADKSILVGDEVARLVIAYAAELAHHGDADDVEVRAISSDGDAVVAILLLGAGAPIMAESAHSDLPEPDNRRTVDYMRRRIEALGHAPTGGPLEAPDSRELESFEADIVEF